MFGSAEPSQRLEDEIGAVGDSDGFGWVSLGGLLDLVLGNILDGSALTSSSKGIRSGGGTSGEDEIR